MDACTIYWQGKRGRNFLVEDKMIELAVISSKWVRTFG